MMMVAEKQGDDDDKDGQGRAAGTDDSSGARSFVVVVVVVIIVQCCAKFEGTRGYSDSGDYSPLGGERSPGWRPTGGGSPVPSRTDPRGRFSSGNRRRDSKAGTLDQGSGRRSAARPTADWGGMTEVG
ncbi:hypothetical protein KM043_014157 [Ampulex compressa]|nr:hypothetical protein KM043_014157 [Ampulex compressa]